MKYFALALFVGIIAGTYSSIFIATPIIVLLGRTGSTSQAAMKAARGIGEESRQSERASTRTKRPTPERMAEIVDSDDEDKREPEADGDEPAEGETSDRNGVATKAPKVQAGQRAQAGRTGSKAQKGRPRGSRPAGGKKKKRKKK